MKSLDLCLYELSGESELPVCLQSRENQGRLNFSVAYDEQNSCLTICILDAKLSADNLVDVNVSPHPNWCGPVGFKKKTDSTGLDSCVVVKLYEPDDNIRQQCTRTCKNTLEPFYGLVVKNCC